MLSASSALEIYMKNTFFKLLVTFYFLFVANKSFDHAGPITEQDIPTQSEWFCNKYTLDFQNKSLSYHPVNLMNNIRG